MFKLKDLAPDRNVTINSTVDEETAFNWLWIWVFEIEIKRQADAEGRN